MAMVHMSVCGERVSLQPSKLVFRVRVPAVAKLFFLNLFESSVCTDVLFIFFFEVMKREWHVCAVCLTAPLSNAFSGV